MQKDKICIPIQKNPPYLELIMISEKISIVSQFGDYFPTIVGFKGLNKLKKIWCGWVLGMDIVLSLLTGFYDCYIVVHHLLLF